MIKLRLLILGGLLVALVIFFQIIPVIFTEALIVFTILSTLPIYIISRANPKLGFISYITCGILITLFSYHESISFILANGILGLSLGICNHYTKKTSIISIISALILTLSISISEFIINIPVLEIKIPGNIFIQIVIVLLFPLLYCIIYLNFSRFIFSKLNKYCFLEDS